MGNKIFEEIKRKYKNSNKYMLCISYEDIGILIQMVEMLDKQINVKIKVENQEYKKEIIHIWDVHYTKDVNIGTICNKIDNFILGLYREENKYYD